MVFVLALSALVPGAARANALNVLVWEWGISPDVVRAWTAMTGVEINQIVFDNGDRRDLLIANPNAPIDLAVIDSAHVQAFGDRGLLLDQSGLPLPETSRAEARWRGMCGRYGVPYSWGNTGIVYRADRLAEAPQSWGDLLKPAPALVGHIAMTDDQEELLAAALNFMGRPMNSGDPGDLRRAFELLRAQVPAVLTYGLPTTAQQKRGVGGQILIGLGGTGDEKTLNMAGAGKENWRFVTPREGAMVWVDCLVVPKRTRNPGLAERFVAFLAQPDNGATNAVFLRQPPPNPHAAALLPATMRDDPQIYPPPGYPIIYRGPFPTESLPLRRRILSALLALHDAQ
ncbi:polyamine ABC transporter substrate-binding protein [Gluconacetobacter takamatsuzukensis]|uniref:Spermidine/putrescine ABC transporter substrate-binding protein n=1 Tax=Gluconacetobacter takamatsuzukensis TaxID=1286190 RepID=A0A7W4PSI0_9PROT|nr:spermidine/putrescine ABC transporter substrate-binding protein [Gluconacetobacter takamatsuzukensis]MBB2204956.1 spermidine/putrescine ABC transporter substrate-binding protein [Gluconacetobacter takamatsuzukensis]